MNRLISAITVYHPRSLLAKARISTFTRFVVTASVAALTVVWPQAAQAATPAWRLLCSQRGSGLCASATGNGSPVIDKMSNKHNDNMRFTAQLDPICSGSVVSEKAECPFTRGSGFNHQFNSHSIYTLRSKTGRHNCIGTDGLSSQGYIETCNESGAGTVFVKNGKYGWVSVLASDQGDGAPLYLCSLSTLGGQFEYAIFRSNPGNCQLALVP